MEEILCRIAGNTILSKIYYNNKFNQLSLDEVQRRFTTFTILGRRYQYKRLSFVFKVKPKLFQRAMIEIFKDIKNVSIYIDDVIISTKIENEKVLIEILDRLQDTMWKKM